MRTYFVLFIFIIPLNLAGQTDTIIYYSGLGRSTDSLIHATFYEKITKKSKKTYLATTYANSYSDKPWVKLFRTDIRKATDSSLTLFSKSLANQKLTRFYHKTPGGYIIKDYIGSVLVQEGFSKLPYPLIRFGRWREYDPTTCKIKAEETYSENQMISNKYWINDSEFIRDVFYFADKTPSFEGGDTALTNFITKNTRYPKYAHNKYISGIVIVSLIVLEDGTVDGIELVKKVDKILDTEALRVVKSIPDKWTPAEIENKNVNMLVKIPIYFSIK
jgi:TonB family protein